MPLNNYQRRINEQSTAVFKCKLQDDSDPPVDMGVPTIQALRLTYYDVATKDDPVTEGIINGRKDQDVLNDNNVTLDGDGNLVWSIQKADTVIVNSENTIDDAKLGQVELHIAQFTYEWIGPDGDKQHTFELCLYIKDLGKVPFPTP